MSSGRLIRATLVRFATPGHCRDVEPRLAALPRSFDLQNDSERVGDAAGIGCILGVDQSAVESGPDDVLKLRLNTVDEFFR